MWSEPSTGLGVLLVVLELLPSSGIGAVTAASLLAVKKTARAIMANPTTMAIGIAG
jgi:hypothetical protein